MNVEIGIETLIFVFWEYLFRNFSILSLQCRYGALTLLVTKYQIQKMIWVHLLVGKNEKTSGREAEGCNTCAPSSFPRICSATRMRPAPKPAFTGHTSFKTNVHQMWPIMSWDPPCRLLSIIFFIQSCLKYFTVYLYNKNGKILLFFFENSERKTFSLNFSKNLPVKREKSQLPQHKLFVNELLTLSILEGDWYRTRKKYIYIWI
jgi:hypothetical protein